MTDATALRLGDAAGPGLYRQNAFRLTGMPTDADRRSVRRRQQQVVAALRVGADIDLSHSIPVSPDDIHAAFDRILGDPRRRLVDEVFWMWDTPDPACSCPHSLHSDHDAAVRAHSDALDREAVVDELSGTGLRELDQLWFDAARRWKPVLRRAAFWDHLRHRVEALDDPQLDASAVDVLRDELPTTLVRPLVELAVATDDHPARLAGLARGWPVPPLVVNDLFEAATTSLFDTLTTWKDEAQGSLDAGLPREGGLAVRERIVPVLQRLESLVPHDRHRRTATTRDDVAILLNNCAVALLDQSGAVAERDVREWYDVAGELAVEEHTRRTVEQNRAQLNEEGNAFQDLRQQIVELVAAGGEAQAQATLRRIRRGLGDGPAARQIDQLMDELGLAGPPIPFVIPTSRGERVKERLEDGLGCLLVIALLAVIAVFILVAVRSGSSGAAAPSVAALFSERVANNAAPATTCIATRKGWNADKATVPIVECGQPHWGEVLGYPALGAVPSPYPGGDQVEALARFECGRLLAQQGLHKGQYTTSFAIPNRASWNDGRGRYENYATCVVHRPDNRQLTSRIAHESLNRYVPVQMELLSATTRTNAPIGTCVQLKQGFNAGAPVPIVRCDQLHWAEVLGYPVLYPPGSKWPGKASVYAAARSACQDLAAGQSLPRGFEIAVVWPAKDWWNDPEQEIYAACLAHRTDDTRFTGALA